ncbi:MAG: hypothetical protein SFU25_00420 [Candidatus Caenarcaniphilales bacterium]|nr:hypothetical protein [Candidatus Caenarcaniphilales bacterium]
MLISLSVLAVPLFGTRPAASETTKDSQKAKTTPKVNPKAFQLCELAVKIAAKGDYDTAIVYLKRALVIEPKFADALFNIGSIHRVKGQFEDSYASFQQLLVINPFDHEARLEKILTLIGMKSYDRAAEELKKVPANQPRYGAVKSSLDKLKTQLAKQTKQNNKPNTSITATESRKQIEELSPNSSSKQPIYNSQGFYKGSINNKSIQQLPQTFSSPTGIVTDDSDNIYVANFLTNSIEQISADLRKKSIFASGDLLVGPSGLIYDKSTKEFLVSNYKSGTIVSIDRSGKMKVLIEDLEKPYSMFMDESGKLYVSEQGKKAVSVIDIH